MRKANAVCIEDDDEEEKLDGFAGGERIPLRSMSSCGTGSGAGIRGGPIQSPGIRDLWCQLSLPNFTPGFAPEFASELFL